MVRRVTGRMHAFDGEVAALNHVTIAHDDIGSEFHVAALFDDDTFFSLSASVRTEAVNRGACPLLERARSRRMIAMRMRDKDVRHRLVLQRVAQHIQMMRVIGTRIDHGDVPLP